MAFDLTLDMTLDLMHVPWTAFDLTVNVTLDRALTHVPWMALDLTPNVTLDVTLNSGTCGAYGCWPGHSRGFPRGKEGHMLRVRFIVGRLASRRRAPHVTVNGDARTPEPIVNAIDAHMPEFEALPWDALALDIPKGLLQK
jgi:hypothetical protein